MNNKKLVQAIVTMAFLGATGIFYSCNRQGEETNVVFQAKEEEVIEIVESEEVLVEAEPTICYVYLCGAIENVGVYPFEEGDRVVDLITLAGGFLEEAAQEVVNLARVVVDGEQIYIPTKEEVEEGSYSTKVESNGNTVDTSTSGGKVNINTASAEELMTIPGIGQAKAQSIISYREKNGGFASIEEIMNIEGIKTGVFNKIQDYILVK